MKNQVILRPLFLLMLMLLGCFSPITLNSQTSALDSIKQFVLSPSPDTAIIDAINEYSFKHSANYPHYSIPLCDVAIQKSQELNDSFRLSRSLNRKAIAYYFMGDYNSALEFYFKSLEINEKLQNPEFIATDYNNIGLVLIEEQLFDEALNYFEKALSLIDSISQRDKYAKVLDNIGIAYYSKEEFEEALVWFQRSLKINREINQRQTIASNIKNVGYVFLYQEKYSLALTHFKLALEIYKEIEAKHEIVNLLNNLALVSIKLENSIEAKGYIEEAKILSPELNSQKLSLDLMKVEADYFNSIKDYKKAISLYNHYIEHKDSLQLSDKRKNYEQLKILSETNQKIKELELLRLINKIQEEKIEDQNTIQIGIIILLSLSIAVIILIINALKIKSKTNKNLETLVNARTKELKLAKEEAEKSDRLKTTFLQNISHEVRTPMNAIVGFSDLLVQRKYNESEREDILKHISKSTLRLLQLFEKISYLAQLENNDIVEKRIDCSIESLFERLFEKYSQQIESCNLTLSLSYNIDDSIKGKKFYLPLRIIESTLNELIENSIKFSENGEVTFEVEQQSGKLNFFVKDTGKGIAPENIEKIFEKFVKLNPTNCDHNDGAGIGLTIAKKNLELIGSEIIIESIDNHGTTMKFSLSID